MNQPKIKLSDIEVILLDMDGVLTDFSGGLVKKFPKASTKDMVKYMRRNTSKIYDNELDVTSYLNLTSDDLWKHLDEEWKTDFWVNLDPYIWSASLWNYVIKLGKKVYVTTHPNKSPYALHGKLLWMKDYIHPDFGDFIFTRDKHLLASKKHLLIDDRDKNHQDFISNGGQSILFPQLWNKAHDKEAAINSELFYNKSTSLEKRPQSYISYIDSLLT